MKRDICTFFFIKVLVFIGFGAFGVVSQTMEKFNICEIAIILKPVKVNVSKFRMKKDFVLRFGICSFCYYIYDFLKMHYFFILLS